MANRYARLDVDFLHKNTARQLRDRLGVLGPFVFVALILRAKDGQPPGTFSYSSDAVAWEKLGLDPADVPFTLDEFFEATGRVKQTSRRRHGVVWNVSITRYADWQKDSTRYEGAVKKARTRAHSTGDTNGTPPGTAQGQNGRPRSTSSSTPNPNRERDTREPIPYSYTCNEGCPTTFRSAEDRDAHHENVHGYPTVREPEQATA